MSQRNYLSPLRLDADPERREAVRARIRTAAAAELARRRHPGPEDGSAIPRSRSRFQVSRWTMILVNVAAVILIAVLWKPITGTLGWLSHGSAGEYVTGPGERLELTLHDGTSVILGEGSRLQVVAEPDQPERELYLEGFALLDVAPDSTRPFVVHTRDATTRVLGTRFVIRAYAEERSVAVAVAEGKVAVVPDPFGGRTGVLLTRGQVGHLASNGMLEVRQDEREVSRLVRSVHGPLRFTDLPLAQVLAELEHLYPVRLVVTDSVLARQPLTVRLSETRLEPVLEAIELAVQAQYERRGDTITFRRLPTNP